MATKLNNRKLLIVLIVLIGVFALVRYFNSSKTKGNFDPNNIELDTASITEVLLYPKVNDHQEIRLFLENDQWMVQKGDFKTKAMRSSVLALINTIQNIKPIRLAARSEDKWENFQVNDSLATKVKVLQKGKDDIGIMIGKFSYKQSPQGNPSQQGIKTISYFRMEGENEVYATNGFLVMTFNRDINAFRDQTLLKANKENIRKLDFNMPGDSSFTIQLIDSTWMVNDLKANETKVEQLLNKMVMNNQNQFADNFTPEGAAMNSLSIKGNNMEMINIQAYDFDSTSVIMNSSLNSEVMFKIPKSGFYNELFKPAQFYLDSI